jgi:hypothetical protein
MASAATFPLATRRAALVGCLALSAVAACTHTPSVAGRGEYLDQQSGDTLAVVARPLQFSRERTDVAAHERDFATLVAMEASNGGKYSDYLLLYRWSTVDKRMWPLPGPDEGRLRIVADGRVLELTPLESVPFDLGHHKELLLPKHAEVVARAYVVDVATLRFLAGSNPAMILRLPQEKLDAPFALTGDGRAALAQFLLRFNEP